MAKILGKDSATYAREREGFLRDLQHFHETRGTPFKRVPKVNGQEIDLYLLYTLVTLQGGWLKVNAKNTWEEVSENFFDLGKCVNGCVALKQIYLRYLDRWERVHFLGEEADRGSDDDEESRHKRWSARALHSVPLTYNYNQHNIPEDKRDYNHLSTNLYKASDYDRLALSLISPLANEQDFAINVCTLLSNDGKHTLKLEKYPRIVDYLLGHAGVFNHSSLRTLFTHVYGKVRKHPLHRFWHDVVEFRELLDLTEEEKFAPKKEGKVLQAVEVKKEGSPVKEERSVSDALYTAGELPLEIPLSPPKEQQQQEQPPVTVTADVVDSGSSDLFASDDVVVHDFPKGRGFKLKLDDYETDSELFCVGRTLGTQEYVGQRVLQVATILRNLSFIEENIPVLVKNKTFVRFFLLCASSRWAHLRNLGMDMLCNVATDFLVKDLPNDRLATSLLRIVSLCLQSEDRACCISSLEVLNKLSQNEANEEAMLRHLEGSIYEKVCSFLTLHDVMLLIYTLECLYSLSSLGERSCNLIVKNHGVVDTLVSLVTVEGKSYGPKACIGMKLVETVPGGSGSVQNNAAPVSSVPTTVSTSTSPAPVNTLHAVCSTVSTTATSTPAMASSVQQQPATPVKTVMASANTTPVRPVPIQPQRLIAISPSPVASPAPAVVTSSPQVTQVVSPQQLVQQQHAHQQAIQENEQFALAWLRATYEPSAGGKVEQQELYKQYINSCAKIGRRGVIAPLHFPRCVRSVFGGTVGPNPVKPATPSESQYYEGIRARAQPLVISIQTTANAAQQQQQQQAQAQQLSSLKSVRRNKAPQTIMPSPQTTSALTVIADSSEVPPASPASPILKAQLSAPPKPREGAVGTAAAAAGGGGGGKTDVKSQVMAHPHLSQALLGNGAGTGKEVVVVASSSSSSPTTAASSSTATGGGALQGQSNTSLIKSLLATKVNNCMTTVSMRTATDCQNVAQVAARQQQQRLLAQQTNNQGATTNSLHKTQDTSKGISRLNGARQLFSENENSDSSVSSSTMNSLKGRKEPPQPPPPPLAPLSRGKIIKVENEDSDSLASSTGLGNVGLGGISSTEDGDNSLTSFEGLLNGIPNVENPVGLMEEDSSSKESARGAPPTNSISRNKPLMLADLLEKKVDKEVPMLNGAISKDARLGDKGLDLVENHIEKALSKESIKMEANEITLKPEVTDTIKMDVSDINENKDQLMEEDTTKVSLKRPATEDIVESECKKPHLVTNMNGSASVGGVDSPAPESVSSSNGDEAPATVSTAAAKLFADFAADILEDEEEEMLQQSQQTQAVPEEPPTVVATTATAAAATATTAVVQVATSNGTPAVQQIIVDNTQQVLVTQQRQLIVSQGQNQMMLPASAQLKTQGGQTVIVQNTGQQRAPMVLQQANTGQILLSSQGQVQLLTSTAQPGQYVLQTGGAQGAYVVAQPQTAVVHGQPQTVLVAQTSQQQGTAAKTIIILQQQPATNTATHHQKVMVTPQGQQVVVTQVPRPLLQQSSVTNNIVPVSTVVKTTAIPLVSTQTTTTITSIAAATAATTTITPTPIAPNVQQTPAEKKPAEEPPKPAVVKAKIIRDLTTPFVCEWGDCQVNTKFKTANEVYLHVCEAHCPQGSEEIACQWDRCDSMKRKRFSLMTHLYDKHCNTEAMKASLTKRKQMSHSNKPETPPTTSATPHPGYAPDAAFHAIKRHALEFVNPKELQQRPTKQGTATIATPAAARSGPPAVEQDDNEGPVTKSIRLTASLILRNLVIYSGNCRRYLKPYEPHLANVALSNVESSRTIAQVLYDLNEGSGHR